MVDGCKTVGGTTVVDGGAALGVVAVPVGAAVVDGGAALSAYTENAATAQNTASDDDIFFMIVLHLLTKKRQALSLPLEFYLFAQLASYEEE